MNLLMLIVVLIELTLVTVYDDLSVFFFFKQKTAYEMRISDWSSDVCSSDLRGAKTTAQHMADMAKSLERDAQLESVLGLRSRELGLEIGRDMGRSIGRDLANSIPFDHGRDLSRGMER